MNEAISVHLADVVDVVPLATLNVGSADHMEVTHAPPSSVRVPLGCIVFFT